MFGINFKNTENATLREFYGITEEEGGVLVTNVLPFSPAFGTIKEGDVILGINGVSIGEDGTFPFRGSERLSLVHLVTKEHIGDDLAHQRHGFLLDALGAIHHRRRRPEIRRQAHGHGAHELGRHAQQQRVRRGGFA